MPDITMCLATHCQVRRTCGRYMSKPSTRQSFADFSTVGQAAGCENFFPYASRYPLNSAPDHSADSFPPPHTVRRAVLEAATQIVEGERNAAYGTPEDSFRLIAALWDVYLETCPEGLRPHDVAMMMALLKIARVASSPDGVHRDSYVDLAGYAACGAECAEANT